jgi:hypothetical protein
MNTINQTLHRNGAKKRAQAVALDFSFLPASSWPSAVVNEVADLLARALVKDLLIYPSSDTTQAR